MYSHSLEFFRFAFCHASLLQPIVQRFGASARWSKVDAIVREIRMMMRMIARAGLRRGGATLVEEQREELEHAGA